MKLLILMSSMLLITSAAVPDIIETTPETHSETSYLDMDACHLFYSIFGNMENIILDVDDIVVLEIEEELDLGIDTEAFVPKGFDAHVYATKIVRKTCSKLHETL